MNNSVVLHSSRFVLLLLFQVLILNHINFLGYINPYPYLLFVLLFPIRENRSLFLILSFLLGLTIDIFSDSGGINAFACIFIAYIRPLILKFTFGNSIEYQNIKIANTNFWQRFTYLGICIIIHHLILFSLLIFDASKAEIILKKTLFSAVFTLFLSVLILALFSKKNK